MKILHVVKSLGLSGLNRVVSNLAAEQVRVGHEVEIFVLNGTTKYDKEFAENLVNQAEFGGVGIEFGTQSGSKFSIFRQVWMLRRRIKKYTPDVVHTHEPRTDLAVLFALRKLPPKIIRTLHNTNLYGNWAWVAKPLEYYLRHIKAVACSRDAAAMLVRLRQRLNVAAGADPSVINNGIPAAPEVGTVGPGDGKPRLAFFGRNDPQKGLDVLAEALLLLPQGSFELDAFVSDQGPSEVREKLNDTPGVSVFPPIKDARMVMVNYDLIVVPSRFEGFGLVALESLLAGVPVVGTSCEGLRECLPPEWPYVAEPGNPTDLCKQLATAIDDLSDLPLQKMLTEIAHKHAAVFTLDAMRVKYDNAYREI